MDIFSKKIEQSGEEFILDNYLPKDGTYMMITMDDEDWKQKDSVRIFYDKKTDEIQGKMHLSYSHICFLDYYSKLIDMNKPMDSKKIIHSNNYLSFFIKKESLFNGKLTEQIINGYFEVLKDPYKKYKSGKVKELYKETETVSGEINIDLLNQIQNWIKANIFHMIEKTKEKDYLKLFFVYEDWEKTKALYIQEGNRYLIPNIYNNNKYNINVDGQTYGFPNNNLQMNDKKPYLGNLSRKQAVPFLLNRQEVLLQAKFYDYLEGFAAKGRLNLYFDMEKDKIIACKNTENPPSGTTGYYLRLKKGKEVEIHRADTVIYFNENLRPHFLYQQILEVIDPKNYGTITKIKELERIVDEVFFSKYLQTNYFTAPEDLSINDKVLLEELIAVRDSFRTWFHHNTSADMREIIIRCGWRLVVNSLRKGYGNKAKDQINLVWSLEDYFNKNRRKAECMNQIEKNLQEYINCDDWDFENDQEYFFAVGQLVSYYIKKSKAAKKPLSLINPFLTANNISLIKNKLEYLFRKYNYDIFDYDRKVKNLISHVMMYEPEGKIDRQMMIAGITATNVIFRKSNSDSKKVVSSNL